MHKLEQYYARAAAHPMEYVIFIALSLPLAISALLFLFRNKNATSYCCIAGFIIVEILFRNGDDIQHHAPRVIGIVEELRKLNCSELLINPKTGQAFPIFVYYSFVPYIIPVTLCMAGLSAFLSVKFTLALAFLLFAYGLYVLLQKNYLRQANGGELNFQFMTLLLFMCSTYVYGIWVERDALAEVALYAFIPWVVIGLISQNAARSLIIIIFLQLSMHPVVFVQSLVCELALAYGITEMSLSEIGRKLVLPIATALILASPFWLPQVLWLNLIMGNAAIPEPFSTTFLGLPKLLDPHYEYTVGPWLILSVALMVFFARGRMSGRTWLMIAGFALMLTIQLTYLRWFTLKIPGISIFQYVWRLMMPAAFIGFGALLAGFRGEESNARPLLSALTFLAVVNVVLISVIYTPKYMKTDPYNEATYDAYMRYENVFGVGLFGPNYARLPQDCSHSQTGDLQAISFNDLQNGVTPDQPFVSVENAPVGLVRYEADGVTLSPGACQRDLILGPLAPGKTISVDESKLQELFYLRVICLVLGAVLYFVMPVIRNVWRRRKPQSLKLEVGA